MINYNVENQYIKFVKLDYIIYENKIYYLSPYMNIIYGWIWFMWELKYYNCWISSLKKSAYSKKYIFKNNNLWFMENNNISFQHIQIGNYVPIKSITLSRDRNLIHISIWWSRTIGIREISAKHKILKSIHWIELRIEY